MCIATGIHKKYLIIFLAISDYKSVLWTASNSKTKDKEYQQFFNVDYDLHILVMNVEAFSTKRGQEFAIKFLRCSQSIIAVDESTTIKTPTAKRTKAITVMAPMAKYRRILQVLR